MNRSLVELCQQCADGEPGEEWVTSGELDGEPNNLIVRDDQGLEIKPTPTKESPD